jgi:hypothetical protein
MIYCQLFSKKLKRKNVLFEKLRFLFSDMINDSDLDGNKVLDFEEFLVMMEKKVTQR